MKVGWANIEAKGIQLIDNSKLCNSIWFGLLGIVCLSMALKDPLHNNFFVYKGVFEHALLEKNLYGYYPNEFFDKNHYGILYSIIIAPFYYLNERLGVFLYEFVQVYALFFVIRKFPVSKRNQNFILLFLIAEMIANIQAVQTNIFVAITLLGAYTFIFYKKELGAAALIVMGVFIKIYSIVGLGLFFFAQRKMRFIVGVFLASILFFVLPMLIASPAFVIQCYIDWGADLLSKNQENNDIFNPFQNMSLLGMFIKMSGNPSFPIVYILGVGATLQLFLFIRYKQFANKRFQISYLANIMLFVILFSTATELSTHIIGGAGMIVWWVVQPEKRSPKYIGLLIFVFFFGTLSTSDLVPHYYNYEFARRYALKALPFSIVWLVIMYQLYFIDFNKNLVV